MTKPPGVIASFFRVHRCLGTGSYGEVYEAVDERTRARVAVKLEPADADFPQLVYEHRVLKELGTSHGFPRVLWFESNNDFNVLVMQKLGPSVEDVRVRNGGTLPVDSVMNIGRQVLERLACCHAKGLAYRDMKPQNVLYEHVHVESSSSSSSSSSLVPLVPPMSSSSSSSSSSSLLPSVFLIDFGLCKRVVDGRTGVHIPMRLDKKLAGTPRYASLNSHQGVEQSRRDDIESLMYMLVFLAKGSLPWQVGASASASSSVSKLMRQILTVKTSTPVADLCDGLPEAVAATLLYARGLAFDAMPNYTLLNDMWRC